MGRAVLTRDQLLRSPTAPPCMEGEPRRCPGTRVHSGSCCPAFRDSPTVPSALSRGTVYSPLCTNCALLTQPPPRLLPLVALGRSPPALPTGPSSAVSTQSHRRSRLTGSLTLAYPQPHPPGGGACSSYPQASAPQPSLGRLHMGPPSQVEPNQHSLSTSGGGLSTQSTSKSALWEQPPNTDGGQMSMPSPSLPSLQLTPPH